MTYRTGLVACIKATGKILREQQDQVFLPFGSEYSVLIKNLKSLRVMVRVSIDGADATDGTSLIVAPNSSVELERFIRAGNLERGNRFKFIERTGEIEEHRGVRPDDGIVRIEWWTERPQPVIHYQPRIHYYDEWVPIRRPYYPYHLPYPLWPPGHVYMTAGVQGSLTGGMQTTSGNAASGGTSYSCSASTGSGQNAAATINSLSGSLPPGITVPGSESHQQFWHSASFPTEDQSEVLILRLCGERDGMVIEQPVTVKTKTVCSTCGKTNEALARFCSVCGTALELF